MIQQTTNSSLLETPNIQISISLVGIRIYRSFLMLLANEFMQSQALPPIIGMKELILVTSVNECSSLKVSNCYSM